MARTPTRNTREPAKRGAAAAKRNTGAAATARGNPAAPQWGKAQTASLNRIHSELQKLQPFMAQGGGTGGRSGGTPASM